MKTTDPEISYPSRTVRISFKRRLVEKMVVVCVALNIGVYLTNLTLGEHRVGERAPHLIPRLIVMSLINWLCDFLYGKYRGI